MTGIIAEVAPYIHRLGWWAVALAILPEGFGIPLPGETALVSASLMAAGGAIPFVPLVITAFLAAVVGNTIGYGLGRYGGRPLILRFGRFTFITEQGFRRTERFFTRYGAVIILFARFLDVFRQLNGIVAGVTRMSFLRFQVYNVLGAAVWVAGFAGVAYELGHSVMKVHYLFNRARYALLLATALALLVIAWRRLRLRRKA